MGNCTKVAEFGVKAEEPDGFMATCRPHLAKTIRALMQPPHGHGASRTMTTGRIDGFEGVQLPAPCAYDEAKHGSGYGGES